MVSTKKMIKLINGRVGSSYNLCSLVKGNFCDLTKRESNFNSFKSNVMLGLLNARSISSKVDSVHGLIYDGLDILVLTETWHGLVGNISVSLAMPPGYRFVDYIRQHDPGHGGLIIYFRKEYKYKKLILPLFVTFEVVAVRLTVNGTTFILIAIYRPGSVQLTVSFYQELVSVLEYVTILDSNILLMGDFNVHVEKTEDPHSIRLGEILDTFQLVNHIKEPTHVLGGILDLVISSHNIPVTNVKIFPSGVISDHSFITVETSIKTTCKVFKKHVRSWRKVNDEQLTKAILDSPVSRPCQSNNVEYELKMFNDELKRIVDECVPLCVIYDRGERMAPWFDDDCRRAKLASRRLERSYRNCLTTHRRDRWIASLMVRNKLYSEKRSSYWRNLIKVNNSSKSRWQVVNKVLCRDNKKGSKSDNDTNLTASQLMQFFTDKVSNIIKSTNVSILLGDDTRFPDLVPLSVFPKITETELKNIIIISPSKTSSLDTLPTPILKKYINLFICFLTSFFNLCLTLGEFPACFKHAMVFPILKKANCDGNDVKNYRPISNLLFISKIMERVVLRVLLDHLTKNNLMPSHQSGYRRFHSTETALLHVFSNLFAATDAQNISLLSLLDMSAAFDCVNHDVLLARLHHSYGITDNVHKWFRSYLSNRTQQVSFKNSLSVVSTVKSGVPQGSVLGPVLFLLYTSDVAKIFSSYGFVCHAFADDIQVLVTSPPCSFGVEVDRFIRCLSEVARWMSSNSLKLNECKTQLLPIGTWQQLSRIDISSVKIRDVDIPFIDTASNLGVLIDSRLSMKDHIRKICASSVAYLGGMYRIRQSLDRSTLETLVHAFITSRLDYCNSLFYKLPDASIAVLQSVQNRAAKLVAGGLWFDHVTPIMNKLHWLTINKRIVFKIGVLMFKSMNDMSPEYITKKFSKKQTISSSHLRSDDLNLLSVPVTRLEIGSRDIAVAGPSVWNSLPPALRRSGLSLESFKKELKTFLFSVKL